VKRFTGCSFCSRFWFVMLTGLIFSIVVGKEVLIKGGLKVVLTLDPDEAVSFGSHGDVDGNATVSISTEVILRLKAVKLTSDSAMAASSSVGRDATLSITGIINCECR